MAAPAPPLRSTQGVCSRGDPSELARVGFYKGTCTTSYYHWSDRSIFGAQLWAVDKGPLAPGRPLQQGTFTLSFCASCVCLIFKRWNSVTILNQGCLSCLKKSERTLRYVEVGLRSAWKSHVIRETTGSTFHSRGWRRSPLFNRWTTTVYCILWPWMFIDGVGGSWGGWDRAVKTVCMSTVFYQASDGVKLYLYYLFYVRVKLNSWHRNIEVLFKQTGCSLVFFF